MEVLGYILAVVAVGLVVGALGRLVVPGPDPMGLGATILLGIVGGLVAGLVARAIWGEDAAPGLFLAVGVTALLVWLMRGVTRRPTRI